jgi:hypothetical protein
LVYNNSPIQKDEMPPEQEAKGGQAIARSKPKKQKASPTTFLSLLLAAFCLITHHVFILSSSPFFLPSSSKN